MLLDTFSWQSVAHDLRRQDGRLDLLAWRSLSSVTRRTAVVLAAGVVLISGVAFSAHEAAPQITSSEDGLSPRATTLNPNADPDGDGLSNQFEVSFGGVFNPNERDTDHDDLRDEEEFNKRYGHTYPNLWDSDGDGIGDGQEVFGY